VTTKAKPTVSETPGFRAYETLPTLINRVAEKIVAVGNADYEPLGLNVRGARVMLALDGHSSLRVYELIERCGIEPSTFSHLLNRLARLGYVTRTRPENDNRAVLVSLTPAGKKVVRQCTKAVARHHAMLANPLTPKEVETLKELCFKIFRNL
jgi:DNA-binding MarR family transcriptional regulator